VNRLSITCGLLLALALVPNLYAQSDLQFVTGKHEIIAKLGDQPIFHYVFQDPKIRRPYFAHIKTPSGIQVSRSHPPQKGVDRDDHPDMHPGIWLSFGDLNGNDYWRLKAPTKHREFITQPKVQRGTGSFEVINEYLSSDRIKVVATESCRVEIETFAQGYLLKLTSELTSNDTDLVFGDQEEMGLGIRLASPLAVDAKQGGRILDSEGRKNGEQIWGKTAAWCDYAGPREGRWAGMTLLTSPKNFRPCWSHARDYGFVAMNPFGLNAFTKADRDDIVVKRGEKLRLAFAVVIHETDKESDYDPRSLQKQFESQEQK
jgi:hypothetical protein